MGNDEFVFHSKNAVIEYFNKHVDVTDSKKLTMDDVYIVWMCKTLQNNKAILSTTVSDGMIYEVTYNGDKQETYLDIYKKWDNVCMRGIYNEK